ncbi:MAG: carboxymuconolactone decarboxylase family protein [Pseudomonadota bacterium]
MPRIPYADPQHQEDATRDLLGQLAPLNIFRMMANAPHLVGPFVDMGTAFLFKGVLDPIDREIAILRVGYLSNASYETAQHEKIGRDVGMSDALIDAVRTGLESAELTGHQSGLIRFVDDLVHNVRASDATFKPMLAALGADGVQELTLVTGYYMMVCRFLETFDVEIEDGGAQGIDMGDQNDR